MQWHLCTAIVLALLLNDWLTGFPPPPISVLLRLLRDSANLTVNLWNHDEVSLCVGCEAVFWRDLLQRWVVSPALGTCLCYVCNVNLVFIWIDYSGASNEVWCNLINAFSDYNSRKWMKEIQFVMMLACDSPQLFFISCMCRLYCGIIFKLLLYRWYYHDT